MSDQEDIEQAIGKATGSEARIAGSRGTAGGCIADSSLLRLEDGREFFLKRQSGAPGIFAMEFRALMLLGEPGVIRVPEPITYGEDFLVMEALRLGRPAPDWQDRMGRALALLHQGQRAPRYGFDGDNWLGRTPQPNGWMEDWADFWRERRLGWQLRLCAEQGNDGDQLLRLGWRLMDQVEELLGEVREQAVLLHGDLWSGNAAADEDGAPVIFDPASYYGHREAEIGMMRLFGGFGPRCEAAYQEVWPLEAGAEERIALYRLYHELNHLNLFGGAYYSACLATVKSLL